MRILFVTLIALCMTSLAFAQDAMNSSDPFEASSKECENIATACRNAGYAKDGGKGFWRDCMKPVLFGKTVSGVTVDVNDVKACQRFKIENLQQQIEEFKKQLNNTPNPTVSPTST